MNNLSRAHTTGTNNANELFKWDICGMVPLCQKIGGGHDKSGPTVIFSIISPCGVFSLALPMLQFIHHCGQPFFEALCATAIADAYILLIGFAVDVTG